MRLNEKYSTMWEYIRLSISPGPIRDDLLKFKGEVDQLEDILERDRENIHSLLYMINEVEDCDT